MSVVMFLFLLFPNLHKDGWPRLLPRLPVVNTLAPRRHATSPTTRITRSAWHPTDVGGTDMLALRNLSFATLLLSHRYLPIYLTRTARICRRTFTFLQPLLRSLSFLRCVAVLALFLIDITHAPFACFDFPRERGGSNLFFTLWYSTSLTVA